jgi:hypothetical protein
MSIALLMNTPAKIIVRALSSEDEYGNETSDTVEVDVLCEVQKLVRKEEEPDAQGEMSDTRWVGYFPASAELDTADAVRVPEVGVLEIVGAPWKVRNPRTKSVHHLEVPLRQTLGAGEAQ